MRGNRSGTEPKTARSALGMRAILSGVALPVALVSAAFFVFQAVATGMGVWQVEAAIAVAIAAIAAIDLVVIRRRVRQRGSGKPAARR
jgi:membrane protein YdbS with pleckstrin-like domain